MKQQQATKKKIWKDDDGFFKNQIAVELSASNNKGNSKSK
jgi:hypothetical protein